MDDGVPLRALAAELVGIYVDAPTAEDEEYAAEAIDDLLDALDDDSDDEALVVLLDLPEDDLTTPLVDDVISMLADTGTRVVERLLDVALTSVEPAASRALDALDRMDDRDKAEGLYDILVGPGPEDLRRTAADELVALGHAGTSRLQDAFDDPWASELVQAAVEAAAGLRVTGRHDAGPGDDACPTVHAAAESSAAAPADGPPPQTDEPPPTDESWAASAGAQTDEPPPTDGAPPTIDAASPLTGDSWAAPGGESAAGPERPLAPHEDALEAEYRAFLERFEREAGA